MRKSWLILLALWASSVFAMASAAEEARGWVVHAGTFDTADNATPELGIEYRFAPFKIKGVPFVPVVGAAATEDESAWIYGGVRYDWEVSEHWVITPQVGASLYDEGDGKDLGGPLEFRSGLEISYRFESGARLGVLFYHLSNARIYDDNPGSNTLALVWGF